MTQNGAEKKLTSIQLKTIEALLTSGNAKAATESAGIGRSTLYRWMGDPMFVAALKEAEAAAIADLARTLAGMGDLAGQALRDALGPGQKMSSRLRASEIVIGNMLRLREMVTLEERIARLEERIGTPA